MGYPEMPQAGDETEVTLYSQRHIVQVLKGNSPEDRQDFFDELNAQTPDGLLIMFLNGVIDQIKKSLVAVHGRTIVIGSRDAIRNYLIEWLRQNLANELSKPEETEEVL